MDYNKWKEKVNSLCWNHIGCSTEDLPDMPYCDMFEKGITPEQMIMYALHELESLV